MESSLSSYIAAAKRTREVFNPAIHKDKKYIISGNAGKWNEAVQLLESNDREVVAFHDITDSIKDDFIDNKPVIKGGLIHSKEFKDIAVLYAGQPRKSTFTSYPSSVPVCCFWHISPINFHLIGWNLPNYYKDNKDALEEVYEMLEDDHSKRTYASIIRARIEADTGYYEIAPFLEYNHPQVHAETGDTVIDAGAFNGDSLIMFSKQISLSGCILAFEPSPVNYVELLSKKELMSTSQIIPLCAAVWKKEQVLNFASREQASSKVLDDGGVEVPGVSIDRIVNALNLNKIDLIKYDVEGAELDALLGSLETLEKYRPKLQISIYHKENDLHELPLFLKKTLSQYVYFCAHHTFYQMETDLYAIPSERLK